MWLGAAFCAIFLAGLANALTDPADQHTHLGAAFFYGFMLFASCVGLTLKMKGKL
jgi:hypothetical protein